MTFQFEPVRVPQRNPRKSAARHHRLNAKVSWVDVVELCCELRQAANEAQHTVGYKPVRPMGRVAWAQALRSMAELVYKRQKLGLSLGWHVDAAQAMLKDHRGG